MALNGRISEQLTPREIAQYENRMREFEAQAAHAKEMKILELEVQKMEVRWSSLWRLPIAIVRLPVAFLLGIGYIIGSFKDDYEPGENFWRFLR